MKTSRRLGFEPALDGIRGIAVLVVVLHHFAPDILGHSLSWLTAGHLGVDLFFVLSGFLITALLLNENTANGRVSFRRFYRRRAFRLLPALTLFLFGHVLFVLTADIQANPLFLQRAVTAKDEIASLLAAQFFTLNWLGEFGDFRIVIGLGHLWSLSVEEQFYIAWPAVTVLLLARRPAPSLVISSVGVGAVGYAGYFYVWDSLSSPGRGASTTAAVLATVVVLWTLRRRSELAWQVGILLSFIAAVLMYRNGHYVGGLSGFPLYTGTPARADSLIVGALLAFLWTRRLIPRRAPTWVALLGWLFLIWAVSTRTLAEPFLFSYGWTLVAIAGAATVWGAIGAEGTLYGRFLSMPWLRAVGKVAYGLYLWHALVFIAVHHWWADEPVLFRAVVSLGATALITTLSWLLVEKPMIARKARKVVPIEPATPQESPA